VNPVSADPPASRPYVAAPPALTLRRELARKALHVTTAAVPVAYAVGAPRALVLLALGWLVAVALVIELGRARSARIRRGFTRVTGSLLRAHEHDRWAGATWLFVAFTLAVALFPRRAAVAAMWGVAVGDASAAIVGRWAAAWHVRRMRGAGAATPVGKTLAGSVACFATTLLGAGFVAGLPPTPSVLAALAAALAERPSTPLDDNLRIVLAVGGAIVLYGLAFP
jgi:dolichol kinase